MPADRKCWDDVEVRSVDDVQRSVDAATKLLDWLECSSLIGTLAPCRADTGGSALPACSLLARECPASVTPGASVVIIPDQTSWCRWQLVQQRLTLVVACLLLSLEPQRGLHCNNRHATSWRRERVSPPNQRQATAGCWRWSDWTLSCIIFCQKVAPVWTRHICSGFHHSSPKLRTAIMQNHNPT